MYVIQVGNKKTVERDHTQLLLRELDPHGRAVTFEFTADAFDSDNDGEEDEYAAKRILSDKLNPSTPGGRLYKVPWEVLAALKDSSEPPSSFIPRYTSVWLDYLKAKRIKFEVRDILVHFVMGNQASGHCSLRILWCIHIVTFHFFAAVMHVPRLGTSKVPPTPISLTCDRHLEPRSILGCVHNFLCAQSATACSGDSHGTRVVSNPS